MGYWQLASLISPQQRLKNPQEGHALHLIEHKDTKITKKTQNGEAYRRAGVACASSDASCLATLFQERSMTPAKIGGEYNTSQNEDKTASSVAGMPAPP